MKDELTVAVDAAAPAAPVIRMIDDGRRSRKVPLDWPIEIDGQAVDCVVVKRMTTKEVADFVETLQGADMKLVRFPMFYDLDGKPLPSAAIDALDDDDAASVMEAASDFLPRRFKVDAGGSAPATGDPTGPSSGA